MDNAEGENSMYEYKTGHIHILSPDLTHLAFVIVRSVPRFELADN